MATGVLDVCVDEVGVTAVADEGVSGGPGRGDQAGECAQVDEVLGRSRGLADADGRLVATQQAQEAVLQGEDRVGRPGPRLVHGGGGGVDVVGQPCPVGGWLGHVLSAR